MPWEGYLKNDLLDENVIRELINQIGRPNLDLVISKMERDVAILWGKLMRTSSQTDSIQAQHHAHTLASLFRIVGLKPVGDSLAKVERKLRRGESLDPGWREDLELRKAQSLQALHSHFEDDQRI